MAICKVGPTHRTQLPTCRVRRRSKTVAGGRWRSSTSPHPSGSRWRLCATPSPSSLAAETRLGATQSDRTRIAVRHRWPGMPPRSLRRAQHFWAEAAPLPNSESPPVAGPNTLARPSQLTPGLGSLQWHAPHRYARAEAQRRRSMPTTEALPLRSNPISDPIYNHGIREPNRYQTRRDASLPTSEQKPCSRTTFNNWLHSRPLYAMHSLRLISDDWLSINYNMYWSKVTIPSPNDFSTCLIKRNNLDSLPSSNALQRHGTATLQSQIGAFSTGVRQMPMDPILPHGCIRQICFCLRYRPWSQAN